MKNIVMWAALVAFSMPLNASALVVSPDDPGAGELRGLQDLNGSGQIGTVRFFDESGGTRVVVKVRGMKPGRIEPLAILRGKSCAKIEPVVGWTLPPLIHGQSTAVVPAPLAKILSGNYVIVAHADDRVPGHNLSCGELYN